MMQTLNMGGYGIYVWSAYSITFFVFGLNIFLALKEKQLVRSAVKKYFWDFDSNTRR